jgi:hypothetical protein
MKGKTILSDDLLDDIFGGADTLSSAGAIHTTGELLAHQDVTDRIDQFIRKYKFNHDMSVDQVQEFIVLAHKFDFVDPDVLREYVQMRYESV